MGPVVTEHNVKYPCCGRPARIWVDSATAKRRTVEHARHCADCRKVYTVTRDGWNRLTWTEQS